VRACEGPVLGVALLGVGAAPGDRELGAGAKCDGGVGVVPSEVAVGLVQPHLMLGVTQVAQLSGAYCLGLVERGQVRRPDGASEDGGREQERTTDVNDRSARGAGGHVLPTQFPEGTSN